MYKLLVVLKIIEIEIRLTTYTLRSPRSKSGQEAIQIQTTEVAPNFKFYTFNDKEEEYTRNEEYFISKTEPTAAISISIP
jgi:hypothetical protein